MKKLKLFLILGALACTMAATAVTATACGNNVLSTPTEFSMDDAYKLSWEAVDEARSYIIRITNVATGEVTESTSRRAYFSLAKLEEGDYEVSVKAVAGNESDKDSKWSVVFAFHKDYESGCLYEYVNNKTAYVLTSGGSARGDVRIEGVYRNKPVLEIRDAAFRGRNNIESITIGENITYIGEDAFYNCSKLSSITLPESVTEIGIAAFGCCYALKTINIPDSITEIAEETFRYCRALESITLSDNLETIGVKAFADCSKLKVITIPDSVTYIGENAFSTNTALESVMLGDGVEEIGSSAFLKCSQLKEFNFGSEDKLKTIGDSAFESCFALTELTLPEGLTEIGARAFYMASNLEKINIPDSVTSVGAYAFNASGIYSSTVEANNGTNTYVYVDDWLVGCTSDILETTTIIDPTVLRDGVVGIADQVFEGAAKLIDVVIPSTVKYIGRYTFWSCPNLWSLTSASGNALIDIADHAFDGCGVLSNIQLNEGLKTIGSYAFANCTQLNNNAQNPEILIPSTVTRIGTEAFKNTGLWKSPDSLGVIYAGNWVVGYSGIRSATITLNANTVGIADYAFYQCDTIQNVIGLSYPKHIGRGAFYQCTELKTVDGLNDRMTELRDYVFYKCTNLLEIDLPTTITSVGRSAFYRCESLNSIDLSGGGFDKGVTQIGPYAFYGCTNLEEVKLSEELKTIETYTFYKCDSLKNVVIPDSVTTISDRAYYRCEGMETLHIGAGVTEIGANAFYGCVSLQGINIPDSVITINDYAFYQCSAATSLTLGNQVKTIGVYAFSGLAKVQTLTIPRSVESIGRLAFRGYTGLTSLYLPGDIETIGLHAFYGCHSATIYTDATTDGEGWVARWNSSNRPIVWGATFSEDKSYVVSITMNENTIQNKKTVGGIAAPQREDYVFIGWATSADATVAEYTAADLVNVPVGTTVYSIWAEAPEEPEQDDTVQEEETSVTPEA